MAADTPPNAVHEPDEDRKNGPIQEAKFRPLPLRASGGGERGETGSLTSRASHPSASTATRVAGGWTGATHGNPGIGFRSRAHVWWGRQVHATRVLVWSQMVLAAVAIVLLVAVATGSFDADSGGTAFVIVDWLTACLDGVCSSGPPLISGHVAAIVLSAVAYFYIISIPLAWIGVHTADKLARNATAVSLDEEAAGAGGLSSYRARQASTWKRFASTLLMLPWIGSVFSLSLPLLLTTLRLIMEQEHAYSMTGKPEESGAQKWIELVFFIYLPLLVLWLLTAYALYGATLAAVYVWRRADGRFAVPTGPFACGAPVPVRRQPQHDNLAAPASFSWMFKGTTRTRGQLHPQLFTRRGNAGGGPGGDEAKKSTTSLGVRSWKSWKSTRNPTLRGYTKKSDDLDTSLMSDEGSGSTANASIDRGVDGAYKSGGTAIGETPTTSDTKGSRGGGHARHPSIGTSTQMQSVLGGGETRFLTPADQMRASRGFAGYSGGAARVPLEPVEEEATTTPERERTPNRDMRM